VGGQSALLSNLRAFELGEERRLAGLVAGLLWLAAAVTVAAMLALPGIPHEHWRIVVAIATGAVAWGTACLTVVPWERVHPIVSHLSCAMGFPCAAVGVYVTGGTDSPAHLYLFFIVAYCAYFYAAREAIPYFAGCIVVTALPLAYDPDAIGAGFFVAEVLILAPTYCILGGFILVGKRRLIELREQARDLALRDPLTGLWNRRALLETLERSVEGEVGTTALLLVDLDYFKDVNTIYGHPVGDRVLCVTADALRAAAKDGDMVARLGGDEFAIVMNGVDQREALAASHRVLHEVREAALGLELPRLRVTASVGFAIAPETGGDVLGLMAAADLALRGSKGSGKDRVKSSLDGTPADAAPA
jgi:diguanylate cyclase (GGDEF)-like protein